MALVEKSVTVHASVDDVATAWRDIERFPHLLDGVREVRRISSRSSRWVITLGGAPVEFRAVTVPTGDPYRIVWQSVSGRRHCGVVTFTERGDATTRVTVRMAAKPTSLGERIGVRAGLLGRRVTLALRQFRDHMEDGRREWSASRPEEEAPAERADPRPSDQVGDQARTDRAPGSTPGTPFGPVPPFTDPHSRPGS
jgi:uncharacterized membrane protein